MYKQIKYLLKLKAEKFLDKKKIDRNWEWTWWRFGLVLRGREVVTSSGWVKLIGRLYWRS